LILHGKYVLVTHLALILIRGILRSYNSLFIYRFGVIYHH